jgi:hypothetical protein
MNTERMLIAKKDGGVILKNPYECDPHGFRPLRSYPKRGADGLMKWLLHSSKVTACNVQNWYDIEEDSKASKRPTGTKFIAKVITKSGGWVVFEITAFDRVLVGSKVKSKCQCVFAVEFHYYGGPLTTPNLEYAKEVSGWNNRSRTDIDVDSDLVLRLLKAL